MGDSLLRRSGQMWKVWTVAGMALGGGALILLAFGHRARPPLWLTAFLVGVALSCGSVFWGALFIRCPGCGARLYWKAVKERAPTEALGWVMKLGTCPTCGADGMPT